MNASSCNFSKIFGNGGDIHHVLPHFQREYRWGENNWRVLWNDAILTYQVLVSTTSSTSEPEHFLGALVTIPAGSKQGTVVVHRLVDGQQRLTTLSLLLCALAVAVEKTDPKLARRIRKLLLNSDVDGDLRFKVLPTTKNNDRAIYSAVIEGKPIPDGTSKIFPAFEFFLKHTSDAIAVNQITPEGFFEVLTSAFQVVWVELDKNENAYQIFESLNTKGERLAESDLVRNYIAMRLSADVQEKVFNEVWAPIEALLDEQRGIGRSGIGELTGFLRHFNATQTGVLSPKNKTYARFRDVHKQEGDDEFHASLYELKRFATLYEGLLRPSKGTDSKLRLSIQRLNALDISVAYPLLLAIADRHHQGQVSIGEYIEACETLENYFVRCFLTNAKTNTYDRMLAGLALKLDWDKFIPSLRFHLLAGGFPIDARVRQLIEARSFYENTNSRERAVTLFERIENHLRAGTDVIVTLRADATLEHILPQTLTDWWRDSLGRDADSIRRDWKDTIGNLTIVTQSYNSSLGNISFPEKKSKLMEHGLKLNESYFSKDISHWDATAIQSRTRWLTDIILEIWPSFDPRDIQAQRRKKAYKNLTLKAEDVDAATSSAGLSREAQSGIAGAFDGGAFMSDKAIHAAIAHVQGAEAVGIAAGQAVREAVELGGE